MDQRRRDSKGAYAVSLSANVFPSIISFRRKQESIILMIFKSCLEAQIIPERPCKEIMFAKLHCKMLETLSKLEFETFVELTQVNLHREGSAINQKQSISFQHHNESTAEGEQIFENASFPHFISYSIPSSLLCKCAFKQLVQLLEG